MSTFTAQVLIGQSHTFDGGIINISHMLLLSEGDTPAWGLFPIDLFERRVQDKRKEHIVWIPTLENMLEDALLMYGVYVLEDKSLVKMANDYFTNKERNRIELYRDIKSEQLERMYSRLRDMASHHKLVLSVYDGSSISRAQEVMEKYQIEVEITESTFVR